MPSFSPQWCHLLAVTEQVVLLLARLDGRATKLGNQHSVADSNAHGDALAITVQATGSNGKDLGLVELLDAGLGQEDAAGGLGLGLDALDEHAVQEGSESTDGADGRLWLYVSGLFVYSLVSMFKLPPLSLRSVPSGSLYRRVHVSLAADIYAYTSSTER